MRRRSFIRFITLICLFSFAISLHQLEDFTYSQYSAIDLQKKSRTIHIHPQRSILKNYEFPQACEMKTIFQITQTQQNHNPQISNIDEQITFLKDKISQLLKKSNEAQLLLKNIQKSPALKNDESLIITENELNKLKKSEDQLKLLNSQINLKALQLQKLVRQNMRNIEDPIFKQSALNFEKKALEQKIRLFEQISKDSRQIQHQVVQMNNSGILNDYFSKLTTIFDEQNQLVDTIDTLLKNHNELAVIKANISHLKSQIKAHDLTLVQKQECQQQFSKIKQKQKHDQQVINLIESLKLKKSEFSEANKYCEGVVVKLVDRVKKLLAGYNYIYICSQGIQETKEMRDKLQKQLQQAETKLHDLQMSKAVRQYRQAFETNRQKINSKLRQLTSLQLDPYNSDQTSVNSIIQESRLRISKINDQIEQMPIHAEKDWKAIQRQIIRGIDEIRHLKSEYCRQMQIYQEVSDKIQTKLYFLDEQQQHNQLLIKLQKENIQRLNTLYRQMAIIEQELQNTI